MRIITDTVIVGDNKNITDSFSVDAKRIITDAMSMRTKSITETIITPFTISTISAPTAQPTLLTFSNITATSMDLSWTASVGGADGYAVFRRTSASPTFVPVDGTTYVVGTTYGDSTCEYFGAGVTFSEADLTASTTCHYDIFAFNGAVGTYAYLTTSPLEGSQATASAWPGFLNCIHNDPTNDYVNFASSAAFTNGLSQMTIAFWAKKDTTGANQFVMSKMNDAITQGWGIRFDSSTVLKMWVLNGTFNIFATCNPGVTVTDWHHYKIVFNGSLSPSSRVAMYVDGVSKTVTGSAFCPATLGSTTNLFALCCWRLAASVAQNFDGLIDEVAIWDNAVGSDTYNGGAGALPDETNLIAYFPMNGVNSETNMPNSVAGSAAGDGTLTNFSFTAGSEWEAHV